MESSIITLPISASYLWTIKNYSADMHSILSPRLPLPGTGIEFTLELTFREWNSEKEDYFSKFSLTSFSSEFKEVAGCFEFFIVDSSGHPRHKKYWPYGRVYKGRYCLGNEFHKSSRVLVNNPIRIFCSNAIETEKGLTALIKSIINSEVINEHCILDDFEKLLTSEGTDIILEGKDKIQVKAHKMILSIRSSVFKAMFSHEMREKVESKIAISDLDGAVLKEMVHFMYTDKVNNIGKYAHDLLYAADKYDLPKLKTLCGQYLADYVTVESFVKALSIADESNCARLKDRCWEFFVFKSAEIIATDSWRASVKANPLLSEEALHILVKDTEALRKKESLIEKPIVLGNDGWWGSVW